MFCSSTTSRRAARNFAGVTEAAGLPAVIAKKASAPYASGPSGDWRRIATMDVIGANDKDLVEAIRARNPSTRKIKFTNLDKIFWPEEGYTKGDLIPLLRASR